MKKPHKYNIGLIGNCSYIAYIDDTANVKWMCMPRFDSSFIFGSLLDEDKGGEFSIKPAVEKFDSKQYYLENTNILVTEFSASDGKFRVIDYAPRFYQYDRYFKPYMLCRKIELISGRPFINIKCRPVDDYGKITPEITMASNHIRYLNVGHVVRLTTDIPLNFILNETSFVLSNNKYLIFTYGEHLEAALQETAEKFLDKTNNYWVNWVKSTSTPNLYQKEIIRSALVLKLHQYEDTGGIIASGSASLPEENQAGRNWDYRYCWMRDTYYTLTAFNSIGHFEELEKYFNFIENIILNNADERIQPLYSITGEKIVAERNLELKGYYGNVPVRIGNDAYTHIQNDVYGQLLVSLLPIYTDLRINLKFKKKSIDIVKLLLKKIEITINEPDAGLWEFRNQKQQHCYTYLFHWAGSKAAMKIFNLINDKKMEAHAFNLANLAARNIEACYNDTKKAYTQAIGIDSLDASCMQLITMNYLDHNSQRTENHLKAIEKELMTKSGLFFRYRHKDDFGIPKNSFLICSFWYIESLACLNKIDEAVKCLDGLLKFSNHLGLFSEDIDPDGGQWGNFPQTYSHVGLMNAVFRISKKLDSPIYL